MCTTRDLVARIDEDTFPCPVGFWRSEAASDDGLRFQRWALSLGLSESKAARWRRDALSDPTSVSLARLDAALRCAASLFEGRRMHRCDIARAVDLMLEGRIDIPRIFYSTEPYRDGVEFVTGSCCLLLDVQ